MYKEGSYVSYRSEGVCVIVEIERRNFGTLNEFKDFYVLSPINDLNSKLYIPVDNAVLVSKMQELCSADDVNLLAKELKDEVLEWIPAPRPRSNSFREILSEGRREMLIKLIHTVMAQEKKLMSEGRHITQGDDAILKRAKRMLIDEFSFTTDITTEQMLIDVLDCKTKCNPIEKK